MTAFFLSNLPQVVVERMLNGALASIVLPALVWILLKAVGPRSSSTRFTVWFVVLLGVVVLPWMESLHWGNAVASAAHSRSAILIPSSWAVGMFYLWVAIATAGLSRVALGLWQIRRLRRNSALLDAASLDPALLQALRGACKRPIATYVSEATRVPMATGFFRPMILIPAWALRELSTNELKVVLLHEAAHLRRWDDWTNLAQKVLRAVFFFHPVVWWIEGKLALEREMACDDLVLEATASPRAYAECLVALAEKSLGRRSFALAQAAVNRVRHTTLRIRQILDGKRSGATTVWKPAVACAASAAMACLFLGSETPKLIKFASPVAPRSISAQAERVSLAADVPGPRVRNAALSIAMAVPASRPKAAKRTAPLPVPAVVASKVEEGWNELASLPALTAQEAYSNNWPSETAAAEVGFRNVAFTASETVFFVMQEQQFNASGDKVLHFNVYRLTVFYPEFYPSNPRKNLSKSI